MVKQEIIINGMSCGHCIMAVKGELRKMNGVTLFDVQIGKAVVGYDETTISRNQIDDAIRAAGYQPV
ncbi:MAG: cation transporter [Bacteroidota bacterium]